MYICKKNMKYFFFTLLFSTAFYCNAQEAGFPRHEVKWNIANTIIFASVELGYEYFIDSNQSVGAEILINDVYNFAIARQPKDLTRRVFKSLTTIIQDRMPLDL